MGPTTTACGLKHRLWTITSARCCGFATTAAFPKTILLSGAQTPSPKSSHTATATRMAWHSIQKRELYGRPRSDRWEVTRLTFWFQGTTMDGPWCRWAATTRELSSQTSRGLGQVWIIPGYSGCRPSASTHRLQSTVPGRTARAPAHPTQYSSPRCPTGTGRQYIRCYGKTNRRNRSRWNRPPDRTRPLRGTGHCFRPKCFQTNNRRECYLLRESSVES